MKTFTPFFILLVSVFSLNAAAQGASPVKMGITRLLSDMMPDEDHVIIGYRVVEKVNMNFGGRVTTYTVPNLSLVSTNDLGPNNSRTITPIYAKAKVKPMTVAEPTKTAPANLTIAAKAEPIRMNVAAAVTTPAVPAETPVAKVEPVTPKERVTSVNIDILHTYERTLEKGYKSADMLRRVADMRFFDGDLVIAAKWYAEFFEMMKDKELDAVYYYRYAASLMAVNKKAESEKMMAVYEAKRKNL